MPRNVLPEDQIHEAIRERVANYHRDIVEEVMAAITEHHVVVVGMRQNPAPRKARKLLAAADIAHRYLEYGSYLPGEWRRRSALKMWTGWPTFPMIWVGGIFVGGFTDLERLQASGELAKMS